MFVKEHATGHLVEVLDLQALMDPFAQTVSGRYNIGEELPDPEQFEKKALEFPSGETLPRCWLDPQYLAKRG